MIADLSEPFDIDGSIVRIGASAGVASESALLISADQLVRNADAALYQAKRTGRGRAQRYEPATGSAPPGSARADQLTATD